MSSIHAADKGRTVMALGTAHRAYGPDFPGWGAPDAASYLREIPAGTDGQVTEVESHGIAPHTRYAVRFANGLRASGLVAGQDFTFTVQAAR